MELGRSAAHWGKVGTSPSPGPVERAALTITATAGDALAGLLASPGAMLERLSAELRQAIQEGIDNGPAIPADQVFPKLNARYADSRPAITTRGKRTA